MLDDPNNNNLVYFQFLGTPQEVPSRIIGVRKEALSNHPDSLLSKLAQDKWKQGQVTTGTTRANPIVTKPMESLLENNNGNNSWLPSMATMMERFYNENEWVLPAHVELEEALSILDFYGLSVEDPHTVQLDQTDRMTRLRAKLFLQDSDAYTKTVEEILQAFENHPRLEKNFLFIHSHHNQEYIRTANGTVYSFFSDSLIDLSYEWSKRPFLRDRVVVDLKAMDFAVKWKPDYESRVIVAGPHQENEYDDRNVRINTLFILAVQVGEAEALAKRQKRSHEEADRQGDEGELE